MLMFMFLYKLLNYISSIAATLCILTLGFYIWNAIRNAVSHEDQFFSRWMSNLKREVQTFAGSATKGLLIVGLLSAIITNTTVHQLVGIHNLKLKPEGTYCFYVEASRYGKTYTLPAQVRIEKETEEVSDSKSITHTYYFIEKIFLTDGESFSTEDFEPDFINETSYYCGSSDEWDLVLLNKHAYSPYVTETNNADWPDITFMLIEILPIAFMLYVICRKE